MCRLLPDGVDAVDPVSQVAVVADATKPETAILDTAVKLLAHNPELRQRILGLRPPTTG